MNIEDVQKDLDGIEGMGRLERIFHEQKILKEKYDKIEKDNGFPVIPDIPIPIDSPQAQLRVKEFLWRVAEELGEAAESMKDPEDFNIHFREEIADALHFLTELTIMLGVPGNDIVYGFMNKFDLSSNLPELFSKKDVDDLETLFNLSPNGLRGFIIDMHMWNITECLALVGNTLKQKPWKSTHMPTDQAMLKDRLIEVWRAFIAMCVGAKISPEDLYQLYGRKNQVNHFRIRSNY